MEQAIEQLCQALLGLHPLPAQLREHAFQQRLREHLGQVLTESFHPQRQLLLSPGQRCRRAYFLLRGMARAYCQGPHQARETTLILWEEGEVVLIADSFFLRQHADIYLEALPDSRLLSLTFRQLQELFVIFPPTAALAHTLQAQYASYFRRRTVELLTLPALERYQALLRAHPRLEQRVPQSVIASYLGIDPSMLSRLRRQAR